MPAQLVAPLAKAFTVIRDGAFPAFSGVTGMIDHFQGSLTKSGQHVSEAGALRVAAIWIATTVLADEVAALTLRLVEKDDADRKPITPPLLKALWSDEPNDDQTRFGIDVTEVLSLALWGVSYTALGWTNGGALGERWPIHPDGLSIERLDDKGLKLTSPGQGELFNRHGKRPEFCYVPMYVLPGQLTPVSPVKMAAELAGLSQSYEETASRLMGRGLNPSVIVTSDEAIDKEEAQSYVQEIERLHGGASNAGKVAYLGGKGMKVERLTMSMVDAEFVAQNDRVFQILMAMWRVPATVAGMVDKPSTWGTGVAEFSRGLERFTLRPIVQRRQAALQRYITQWVDPKLQVKYIFDSMLSSSPKERVEIQRGRLMMGTTSVERILAQEDEPPFEDDETTFTQLALATNRQREFAMARDHANAVAAQATAVANLITAGVPAATAWTIMGIDPATIEPLEDLTGGPASPATPTPPPPTPDGVE